MSLERKDYLFMLSGLNINDANFITIALKNNHNKIGAKSVVQLLLLSDWKFQ